MNHLVIGLGGTGGKSIRALRKLAFAELQGASKDLLNRVSYLYVDSSREMMSPQDPSWKVLGTSVQLPAASQLQITGEDLAGLLANVSNYPGIQPWIGSQSVWREILGTIVGEALGGQKRRLGRFLFARKVKEFNTKIQSLVQNLQRNGDSSITFHVIAGLAGGTGSGCIIDAVAQIRKVYSDPVKYKITAYLLLPDEHPLPNWDSGNYHANGFAALTELNALSTGAYRPVDVDNGNILELKDAFNGAYLIANENENGYIANTDSEIPRIIAEFLYQKVFIASQVGLSSISRMENAENGDGTPETSPTARIGQRSKRFLTFGIKRITVPEEEIKEFLTLTFAQQGIHQLRFNNWQSSLGFVCEPKNFDANALVRDASIQSNWKLSDQYLLLEDSILSTDDPKRQWKSLHSEWESVIPAFKKLAQEQEPKNWITSLTNYCQNRFDETFRNLGVKEFYRTKSLAKVDIAKEIRRLIDADLLSQWRNGERSLYDISRVVDALLLYLAEKADLVENKKLKCEAQLDDVRKQIGANLGEWSSMGVLSKAFGKRNNIFERQTLLLQSLYTDLTRVEAYGFAKSLLVEITTEVRDLKSVVDSLLAVVNQGTNIISESLDQRLAEGGDNDARSHIIRFYDPAAVKSLVKELSLEEAAQASHAALIRSSIVDRLGDEPSLTRLSDRLSVVDIVDTITTSSERSALAAHANLLEATNRKILGVSILSKLEERYGSDKQGLRVKIHELVTQAGTFLSINTAERNKVAPGIPQGAQVLVSKMIVILPKSPNQDGFVSDLKDAFREALSGDLEFIESPDQQREITILSLKNLFPIRMAGILPFLKDRYEDRIKSNSVRLSMELHTSGSIDQYPSLFALSGEQQKVSAGTNLLLGIALGMITETPSGNLVFNSKDDDGFDNPPIVLGQSVLESISSMSFDRIELIGTAIEKSFSTLSSIQNPESVILGTVEKVKNEVKGDTSDPDYIKFVDCAKSTLKKIRESTK